MIKKIIVILVILAASFGIYRLVDKDGAMALWDKLAFWNRSSVITVEINPEQGIQEQEITLGEGSGEQTTGSMISGDSLLDAVSETIDKKESTQSGVQLLGTGIEVQQATTQIVVPAKEESKVQETVPENTTSQSQTQATTAPVVVKKTSVKKSSTSVLNQLFK